MRGGKIDEIRMLGLKFLFSETNRVCLIVRVPRVFAEYATVGYMAKRIQMRKNRFQKIAESMKTARENPGPPGVPGDHGDHAPKQTVSVKSANLSYPIRLSFRFRIRISYSIDVARKLALD